MAAKWIKTVTGDLVRWDNVTHIEHETNEITYKVSSYFYVQGDFEKDNGRDFLDVSSIVTDFDGPGTSRPLDAEEVSIYNAIVVEFIESSKEIILDVGAAQEACWEFFDTFRDQSIEILKHVPYNVY